MQPVDRVSSDLSWRKFCRAIVDCTKLLFSFKRPAQDAIINLVYSLSLQSCLTTLLELCLSTLLTVLSFSKKQWILISQAIL